jgi:hypothetical protein
MRIPVYVWTGEAASCFGFGDARGPPCVDRRRHDRRRRQDRRRRHAGAAAC